VERINVFGLVFVVILMIPNILFFIRCREDFKNSFRNKRLELLEQVGRFGCFGFMVFNVPGTFFGWWSDEAFAVYLIVDTILTALYCAAWIVCRGKSNVLRALLLSVIPSVLFLFSAVMSRSVLLGLAAVMFAPSHIFISYKNAKAGC